MGMGKLKAYGRNFLGSNIGGVNLRMIRRGEGG